MAAMAFLLAYFFISTNKFITFKEDFKTINL